MGIRVAPGVHKKTPDEIRAFNLTFEDALVTGESLLTVEDTSITVDGTAGLVIDSAVVDGSIANVVVSAGVAGSFYYVRVRVSTNTGQILEGVVTVSVQEAI